MPHAQNALLQQFAARIAVVARQRQRARAGLGEFAAGTADDATQRQTKGLRIDRRGAIQCDRIANRKAIRRSKQRGARAHGQRASAERVIVPHAQNALLQEGATRVAVVASQGQH